MRGKHLKYVSNLMGEPLLYTLYFITQFLLLIIFLLIIFYNLRSGILIGLTITTFTLGAFYWQIIPINGIAFSTQILFFILSFLYYFLSSNNLLVVNKEKLIYAIIFVIFIFIVFSYNILSKFSYYGIEKSIYLTIKSLFPIIGFYFLIDSDKNDEKLIFKSIIVGSLLMALKVLTLNDFTSERVSGDFQLNTIFISRIIGLAPTLIISKIIYLKGNKIVKLFFEIIIIFILVLVMFITGSRGPLFSIIFTTISISIIFIFSTKKNRIKLILKNVGIFLLILTVFSSIIIFIDFKPVTRIINKTITLGENTSDQGRINRYKMAWEGIIKSHGLGVGTGGFAQIYGGKRGYPHNILFEILLEQGVLGFGILMLIISMSIKKIYDITKYEKYNIYRKSLVSLWFYSFANALISYDIGGNYFFWITSGLIWALHQNMKINIKKHKF